MSTDPFFGRFPVTNEMNRARGRVEQVRENSSRLAYAWAKFDTVGSGEFTPPLVADFGCTFIEQPNIMSGFAIEPDQLIVGRYPRVSAGVSRWVRTPNGYYTGAYVFFVIDTQGPDTDPYKVLQTSTPPVYTLHHTFMFSGVAIKALPHDLLLPGT